MKRGDDRHSQFAQKRQNVTAGRPAENAELVLQADDVHVADVEEVRRAQIGRQILLLNLEANHFRILVAALDVIDRHRETLALRMRGCHGGKQVGRKRGDAALARQVVADERDLANFGTFFHEAVFHSSRLALLCTRVCAPTANVPPQREESTLPGLENPLAGAREGYSGR